MRLRDRLAKRTLTVYSTHTVMVSGVASEVQIMRPTAELREQLMKDAMSAKEISADSKPLGSIQSVRFAARVLAALLLEDGEQAFPGASGPGELMRLDEFDELAAIAGKALSGEPLEETQGNSDAPAPPTTAGER